jgi:hypothetical protein
VSAETKIRERAARIHQAEQDRAALPKDLQAAQKAGASIADLMEWTQYSRSTIFYLLKETFYVKRSTDTRDGWTGPIRSERQADREAAAWVAAGWSAEVVPSSPEVKREVRAWQKARNVALGRI